MNSTSKAILMVLLVIYILSPVDLCPGPVDDIILFLCAMCSKRIESNEE